MSARLFSSDLLERLRRSLAVSAVVFLAFGAAACSDDDDDDGGTGPSADCIDEIDFSETIFDDSDAEAIGENDSESGSLSTSDVEDQAGFFYDIYVVSIESNSDVTVTLDPSGFDAELYIFNSDFTEEVGFADDGGVGDPEEVTGAADEGCYVIMVTSFDPEETGSYTLEVDAN